MPEASLRQLPSLGKSLPEGARRSATDPDHYDFFGQRCVKDLKPVVLTPREAGGTRWLELRLRHNCWKHEEDLGLIHLLQALGGRRTHCDTHAVFHPDGRRRSHNELTVGLSEDDYRQMLITRRAGGDPPT
jgi:hypothetical protein